MSDIEFRVTADRSAIEVRTLESTVRVTTRLKELDPAVNARRMHGQVVIGFEDASRLLGSPASKLIAADAETQRILGNRARLRESSRDVLDEVHTILESGEEAARQLIHDLTLPVDLDDHQATNVAIMTVRNGWGACVFDEQGTGKTLSVIAAFDVLVERGEADVLIVIAPKSMVAEWAAEFRQFAGNLYRVSILEGDRLARARALESGADVVVLNYEAAVSLSPNLTLLARRTRAVLAVDESFFVKNPRAIRSQAVAELREWCTRCFVLCGTPAPNAPHDLVAQFDLVDFGLTFSGVALDTDRTTAAGQVRAILDRRGVYLRTLKRQALPDLPQRVFSEVHVELASEQRASYESALDDLIIDLEATIESAYVRRIQSFLERRNALLRICSDPSPLIPGYQEIPAKIGALDRLLGELIGDGEKVVLWSFYRASLDRIASRYAHYGVARIDGSIPNIADRRDAVRRFQEDDETMLFVANPAAAGAGLTLHRSRLAIYESFSNQAAHYLQSLDRIHRRGQDRPVEYMALIASGTIEEIEYARLLEKANRQAELLGDDPVDPRPSRKLLLDELLEARRLLEAVPT